MTALNWWSVAALAFLLIAIPVLLCAAHIPGLREITGAEPLEAEPKPYTHTTEQDTTFLLGDYTPAAARRAAHVSQLPHGSTPRGTHL